MRQGLTLVISAGATAAYFAGLVGLPPAPSRIERLPMPRPGPFRYHGPVTTLRDRRPPSRRVRRQSKALVRGLPLVSIAFGPDPEAGEGQGEAVGVIALGDRARGFLALGGEARGVIALGGSARGIVAMGGRARGLLAMGGVALGVVAMGGVAVGLASMGGAALGAVSLGGASVGYLAAGGTAWGRHTYSAGSRHQRR